MQIRGPSLQPELDSNFKSVFPILNIFQVLDFKLSSLKMQSWLLGAKTFSETVSIFKVIGPVRLTFASSSKEQ